jgi:hypothetical protein
MEQISVVRRIKFKLFDLKWYFKIKKAQIMTFFTRNTFYCHHLRMTIYTDPSGNKKIFIFDKDTAIYYEWKSSYADSKTGQTEDGQHYEVIKLDRPR